jgi:hypothetical protein
MERLIQERLLAYVIEVIGCIPDTQFGFLKDRSTMDAIFVSRVLTSLSLEVKGGRLMKCFIDLKKAYDNVDRLLLFEILEVFGLPPRLVQLIRALHDGAEATVYVNGEASESFVTTNGLKQGSVLSPILFNIFFGAIMHAARKEWAAQGLGIQLVNRPYGKILTKRKHAKESARIILKWLTDIGFADDCVICARTPDELQKMLDIFHKIVTAFGLVISTDKTKVMDVCTAKTANTMNESGGNIVQVCIDGKELEVVENFKYLGSIESMRGDMEKEVQRVRQAMYGAFRKLKHVFLDRRISLRTRLVLFNSVMVPYCVYGCQAWNLHKSDMASIESVYCRFVRNIMGIKDPRTPLVRVIDRARAVYEKIYPVECQIIKTQLRYVGHVIRRGQSGKCSITKEIASAFIAGNSRIGASKVCDFKSAWAEALDMFGIDKASWEDRAADKNVWKDMLVRGMNMALTKCKEHMLLHELYGI